MHRRFSLPLFTAILLMLPLGCGTSRGAMSVSEFLRAPVSGRDVITVRGQFIESLNDRTFAMGNGNDVILVVYPADNVAAGTRGAPGQTVVVTGTAETFRRGDPAMPFIDDRITDAYLGRPGIIATNVQVVETGA